MSSRTLIYHVIGTLARGHIRASLESLARQNIHWERFVLYNGGDYEDKEVLQLLDRRQFDAVEIFPYDKTTPKAAVADWAVQMREICGADRYLVHKADFYLANGVCRAFEELPDDFGFVLFNKFDMKERVTIGDLKRYAGMSWAEALADPTTGTFWENRGKKAIQWHQSTGVDGTMHGYTDEIRGLFDATPADQETRWGVAWPIKRLASKVPFVQDDRFFAMHMWHDTPDRADLAKQELGERF